MHFVLMKSFFAMFSIGFFSKLSECHCAHLAQTIKYFL